MTCNMVNSYKCSEGTWYLVPSTPKMEATCSFKTLTAIYEAHVITPITFTFSSQEFRSHNAHMVSHSLQLITCPWKYKTQLTLIMALIHSYSNIAATYSKKGSWHTSRIPSYCYVPKDWDRIRRHFTRYHGSTRLNYVQHESTFNLASNKTWWDIVSWLWEES